MKKIVIFASGSGTNAQNIVEFSKLPQSVFKVEAIFCNNPNAFVIQRAKMLHIPCIVFDKNDLLSESSSIVFYKLKEINPDLIVLAGFLLLIPPYIVHEFQHKIINIHPALLPKYGGKGMFGEHVHHAVISNKDQESGITIHFVSELYDDGAIILQKSCSIDSKDTPITLAEKIHLLEKDWFPITINKLLT